MELPIVEPAPAVIAHMGTFHHLFENQGQLRHFQHDLTELIVLPNKGMANMARCILDSTDKTNGVEVFDAWHLAGDLIQVLARRRKDWISLLKTNRLLGTASSLRRDAYG